MRIRHLLALAMIGPLASACTANPVFPDHDETLGAEVTFSSEHLATLTEFSITVHVEDEHGEHVTAMAEVRAEFRYHDTETWRAETLTLDGEEFTGTHTFMTSGEYDFRVIGIQLGDVEELVLYEAVEHMEVERIHIEVGDLMVEFETFPGHVHEGGEAAARFWIMEADADADGHHHMMEGLSAEIHVTDANGAAMEHEAHEEEPGTYEAHHTFLEAGEAHFEIHFTVAGGAEQHAEFRVPVAHEH